MGILNLFNKKAPPPPVTSPETLKPVILVVDDDQFLREFYQQILVKTGYRVITASDGKEGLEAITNNKPDVVLLDIMMPLMDGNEVLKKLSENPETKKVPIIILTNAGTINNMDNAKYYSAYKFLIKSNVTPEEVLATVKEVLLKNYNSENPKYFISN
jgi:DNA-binding response OmpR family regulator